MKRVRLRHVGWYLYVKVDALRLAQLQCTFAFTRYRYGTLLFLPESYVKFRDVGTRLILLIFSSRFLGDFLLVSFLKATQFSTLGNILSGISDVRIRIEEFLNSTCFQPDLNNTLLTR